MNILKEIKNKKIMLIDDDESIRDALSTFFLYEGIRIDALGTAEEGIEALKRKPYDVLIVDYTLPGMDGLSFLRKARTMCPDAYKVLITSLGSDEISQAAREAGSDEFIQKPITMDLIKSALSHMMNKPVAGRG